MSIVQFLRIFWARRATVLIAMIASGIGALIVAFIVQPRYEASASIMFDMIKPDPITGEVINGYAIQPYFDAQSELVKDYGVTGEVADALGMESDPQMIDGYRGRASSDTRDFRHWLAAQVAENIDVGVNGTVMQITYRAPTAVTARVGAESTRRAYIRNSIDSRRIEASKNAQFYGQQAEAARKLAEDAESAKAAYERANGIVMDGQSMDMESERLAALATAAAQPAAPIIAGGGSGAALQLAQIDAKIAEMSSRLGPNHPDMQALRAQRSELAKVAAQEQSGHVSNGMAAINRALEAQKARVIGQRDKVERLRQLQGEVDLRREQYRTASAKAAQFNTEASADENNMSPLGIVVTPKSPVFPKKSLMVGGALALGAALGLAIALLLELLNRRVRGVEDMQISSEITCIGVVEGPRGRHAASRAKGALGLKLAGQGGAAA